MSCVLLLLLAVVVVIVVVVVVVVEVVATASRLQLAAPKLPMRNLLGWLRLGWLKETLNYFNIAFSTLTSLNITPTLS